MLVFCESSQLLRAQIEYNYVVPGRFTAVFKKKPDSLFLTFIDIKNFELIILQQITWQKRNYGVRHGFEVST